MISWRVASQQVRRLLLGLVVTVVLVAASNVVFVPQAEAASDPVWVNDATYGSAGKGFYHDFVSGQVWTAERGWHNFSPQPARASTPPLWVNFYSYGSAGKGFYLDTVSGLVWTAERDWHAFSPSLPMPASAPSPTKTPAPISGNQASPLSLAYGVFCSGSVGCEAGSQPLWLGYPIATAFSFSSTPAETISVQAWLNGTLLIELFAAPPPYIGPVFNTGTALGNAPVSGTIEMRVFVGQKFIGAFSALISSAPGSAFVAPGSAGVATPTRTATPYVAPTPYQPPSSGRRIGAICRDGTRSFATGSGACSWHGGVAYWLYE